MTDVYECQICGHEYDPKRGEPGQGIQPGVTLEKLPDTWMCPVCRAEKRLFKKL